MLVHKLILHSQGDVFFHFTAVSSWTHKTWRQHMKEIFSARQQNCKFSDQSSHVSSAATPPQGQPHNTH